MKIFNIPAISTTKKILPLALGSLCATNGLYSQTLLNKNDFKEIQPESRIWQNSYKLKTDVITYSSIQFNKENRIHEKRLKVQTGELYLNEVENIPSPLLTIANNHVVASIVVDISRNLLFKFDTDGNATNVYRIATGKKITPTIEGLKQIKRIEKFPYNTSAGTKRCQAPYVYGPRVLVLVNIDPLTGKELGSDGQFIHGTNNPNSIGKYASKGCARMHNADIKEIAEKVSAGEYIKFIK